MGMGYNRNNMARKIINTMDIRKNLTTNKKAEFRNKTKVKQDYAERFLNMQTKVYPPLNKVGSPVTCRHDGKSPV